MLLRNARDNALRRVLNNGAWRGRRYLNRRQDKRAGCGQPLVLRIRREERLTRDGVMRVPVLVLPKTGVRKLGSECTFRKTGVGNRPAKTLTARLHWRHGRIPARVE